jgi:hypothetical protein
LDPGLVDDAKHFADLHVVAVLAVDAREDAGGLGVDLEVDLVRLEFDQRVAGGDGEVTPAGGFRSGFVVGYG